METGVGEGIEGGWEKKKRERQGRRSYRGKGELQGEGYIGEKTVREKKERRGKGE